MTKKVLIAAFILCSTKNIFAQNRNDKADYTTPVKNEFYENIKKQTALFETKEKPAAKRLMMDYTGIEIPKNINEFKIVTVDKPVSQGITGTCWCYSTTSFYESEITRISGKNIHLSEMYTVYWQYVEKVKEFVKTRGESLVDEGSETNAVQNMMQKYGIVPLEDYTGLLPGQPYQNHAAMIAEIREYLQNVKNQSAWNEDVIIATTKNILNHYMTTPPTSVVVNGKTISPLEYLKYTGLHPEDYITFMSLKSEDFNTNAEYKVADNWWHSKDYFNIPVEDFMHKIKNALQAGYSVSIGGDVSESGINSKMGVMMIPSYDIPSSYINDDARLMRFLNGSTTDDHAMHLIGYTSNKSGTWFLVKDSGAGGHNNNNAKGYWMVHEDYIKLKMMTATMHKNAVET